MKNRPIICAECEEEITYAYDDVILWNDETFCPDCFISITVKPEAASCIEDRSLIYQAFGAEELTVEQLLDKRNQYDPDAAYEAWKEEQNDI